MQNIRIDLSQADFAELTDFLNDERRPELIQVVMPDFQPLSLPVQAVYPRRRYLPVKVRFFVDFLIQKFAEGPIVG
jgi:DNA-binding transcriptional LysR family regulator